MNHTADLHLNIERIYYCLLMNRPGLCLNIMAVRITCESVLLSKKLNQDLLKPNQSSELAEEGIKEGAQDCSVQT